jgi:hypothetical protein
VTITTGASESEPVETNMYQEQLSWSEIGKNTLLGSSALQNLTGNARSRQKSDGIIIGGKWKVTALGDGMNLTVSRLQGKTWKVEGYFFTLAPALSFLIDQQVRDSDLNDLQILVEKVETIKKEIIGFLVLK